MMQMLLHTWIKIIFSYDKSKGNFKKQLLSKSDATLTRLVLQSGGYKTAKLSTGVDFGKSFKKHS